MKYSTALFLFGCWWQIHRVHRTRFALAWVSWGGRCVCEEYLGLVCLRVGLAILLQDTSVSLVPRYVTDSLCVINFEDERK